MAKFCKCEIQKDRTGTGTDFTWPSGHDEQVHTVVYYENKGNSVEHAVSVVPDDFDFSQNGYTELTKAEAKSAIGDYVQNNKDLSAPPDWAGPPSFVDNVASNRKAILDRF